MALNRSVGGGVVAAAAAAAADGRFERAEQRVLAVRATWSTWSMSCLHGWCSTAWVWAGRLRRVDTPPTHHLGRLGQQNGSISGANRSIAESGWPLGSVGREEEEEGRKAAGSQPGSGSKSGSESKSGSNFLKSDQRIVRGRGGRLLDHNRDQDQIRDQDRTF